MNNNLEKAIEFATNKNYKDAFRLFEEIENKNELFLMIKAKNYYLWSIYYSVLKKDFSFWKENFDYIKKYVKIIHNHSNNDDIIYFVTVFRVIDYFESFASVDYLKIERWIDLLDVDKLSTDLTDPKRIDGRMIQFPSDKEKWFMIKSKCCESLEKYHECLDVSRKALNELQTFNFDNDIWFRRREAISLANLNQLDKAIEILEEILLKKREGFLYFDLGNLLYQKGSFDKAKENLFIGLKKMKKLEFCVSALKILSDIYIEENENKKADVLMGTIIVVKKKNGWKLKGSEQEYSFEDSFSVDYPNDKDVIAAYYKIINGYSVIKSKDSDKTYHNGYIKTLFDNKRSGFIFTDSGESVYFNTKDISDQINSDLLNLRVSFQLIDSFDKKKNKPSKAAIDIWLEK